MSKSIAVVLASGGMDSCVAAAMARTKHRLAMLHITYGQRTQSRELQAFHAVADHYGAEHRLVVSIDHLSRIGGSSLTDRTMEVPAANLDATSVPTSYVPFRNANLLSIAVSWAEVLGSSAIYAGAVEEDSSGYPDCREEFFKAFGEVVRTGTKPDTHITIETPVIHLTKPDIVRKGVELGVPFHLTWSCYKREDIACGVCDSCALRLRGFQLAGVDDPLPYEEKPLYAHAVSH